MTRDVDLSYWRQMEVMAWRLASDTSPAYVNGVQFRNGVLAHCEVAALGGAAGAASRGETALSL
jgi:hypothetical protein